MIRSYCIDTISTGLLSAEPPMTWRRWFRTGLALVEDEFVRMTDRIHEWHGRARQRRALMSLSDHALKDIGLSRADATGEFDKPFWKP